MALVEIGRINLDLGWSKKWFWHAKTSLQLLNLDWGSDLNNEQFLDDLILAHMHMELVKFMSLYTYI